MKSELFTVDRAIELFEAYIVPLAINLALALVVFVAGRWGARLVTGVVVRLLRRANIDESLVAFIGDVVNALLLMVVVIAALERLGIKTTAAIAVLGAAGLAIGMALQGSLGNFASGVLIIVFKPYRVGDTVQIAGKTGIVDAIQIFTTVLHTTDMRKVIIPNGAVTSASIENFTARGSRRVELVLAVAHGGDLPGVRAALHQIVDDVAAVATDPPPEVTLIEIRPRTATFEVHAHVEPSAHDPLKAELLEKARQVLGARLTHGRAS